MPTVSVIIPAYNASQYIVSALHSVREQTLTDLEVIVVDDGSKDNTAELVTQHFPDVICVRKPNGGASSARNVGMEHATGEFVAFLDADDTWHPQKLEAQVALMRAYPQAMLCRTRLTETPIPEGLRHDMAEQNGLPRHHVAPRFADTYRFPYFGTTTIMVRREVLARSGVFDTSLKVAEDVDFFLRIAVLAECVPCVDFPAIYKRPVQGSLGDDSELGYQLLLKVYARLLVQHPEAQQMLSRTEIRTTTANLWARLAMSQRNLGKRREAFVHSLRSMLVSPNLFAFKVMVLAIIRSHV